MGQQVDVPLPLGAGGGSALLRRPPGAGDDAGCGRGAARRHDRDGARAHGRPRLVRGLLGAECALHRAIVPGRARPPRRPLGRSAVSVRGPSRLRRFWSMGADLQRLDRSDAGRADRRTRAPCARVGAAHALAACGRRFRILVAARAHADAVAATPGRTSLHALDPRQRRCRHRWPRRLQRRSRRPHLDAEAAEVPRQVATRAARQVRCRRRQRRARAPDQVCFCRRRRRTCRAARAATWRGTSAASASRCGHRERR